MNKGRPWKEVRAEAVKKGLVNEERVSELRAEAEKKLEQEQLKNEK